MMEALFGLLGTLLGAVISWFVSDRHAKMQTTFDLHREFYFGDLLESRRPADKIFAKYLDETYDQFSSSLEPEQYTHIWNTINFYQRLWVAVEHKQVVIKLVPDLFGEVFIRWYILYFEKMFVPLTLTSSKRLKKLRNWFETNSEQDTFKEWVRLARKERQDMMERMGLLSVNEAVVLSQRQSNTELERKGIST
ncbi:hypothetical protein I8751_09785 [Nostocaceae cyanobacterium CENA357]|uniref:Uncharacterized protein n=1 Tax=Atlanticothrix silvestris CENA357 TaxID=1725252 RepID=A0A8J7HCM8_9CYAN|nr:hypothetical protein [Atlanticothrix silvestris]MBH8552658.1 hypothetical protein [Atlanticothrix silvestris CENA357]